jgi:fumarylacetoacetate (FAA) hydrolase
MKLATLRNGDRDGRLVVVCRDLSRYVEAVDVAPTLQRALEDWARCEPLLQDKAREVEAGAGAAFDPQTAMAPIPRAPQWLDGSAFKTHGALMDKALNRQGPPPGPYPLMYQGASDTFLGPCEDMPMPSEDLGIDFEAEFGVVVSDTPMGVTADDAANYIKLAVVINDASLRALAGREMDTGFGWIQAKPSTSFAPCAVTLDELGEAWSEGRIHLPIRVRWNGEWFGAPNGSEMGFGFHQLIAHAARTRRLSAGTIIGSGTVSNANYREAGSACIAEKRAIEKIDKGDTALAFMRFGDRVRIEVLDADGRSVCGAIDQRIVEG